MKLFITIIFLFLGTKAFTYERAHTAFEEGLTANENILDFLLNRPCHFGLTNEKCDMPMTPEERLELSHLFKNLERWKKESFTDLRRELDTFDGLPIKIQSGKAFSFKKTRAFNPTNFKLEEFYQFIYADDSESQQKLQELRILTTFDLLIYDSFFRLAEVLNKSKRLRVILEHDMDEEGKILEETYKEILDKERWLETKSLIALIESGDKMRASKELPQYEKFFDQYLQSSFMADKMKRNDLMFRMTMEFLLKGQMRQTRNLRSFELLVGRLSKFFGNTIGKVQTREGKLKSLALDAKVMDGFKKKLKPLSMLLEKTPHRLTDKFIPGYFGHVAIWLGNVEEWADLPISFEGKMISLIEHPEVTPHLEAFSQNKYVLEALRIPGVTLNTLEHFMDIDDFVILDAPDLTDEKRAEYILRSVRQVGKPYDFNFDVETDYAIVCSELVYTVFKDYHWPTAVSFGRHTINPDHVAWKAVDNCFTPVEVYLDGKKIERNLKEELKKALQRPGGIDHVSSGACASFL